MLNSALVNKVSVSICGIMGGAFVSVGVVVSERQSDDSFVCFGAKPIERACARDFLRDRKKTRKGKVPGQSTGQKGVSDSQRKATVRERRLLSEELGPVDPKARSGRARAWASVSGSCVGIFVWVHARDRHRSTECRKSAKNFSLRLGLTQVRACLFFCLLLLVVYVVSYVFVKQCEMPPARDEMGHWTIGWPWAGKRSWDSGDRPCGYIVTNAFWVHIVFVKYFLSYLIRFSFHRNYPKTEIQEKNISTI